MIPMRTVQTTCPIKDKQSEKQKIAKHNLKERDNDTKKNDLTLWKSVVTPKMGKGESMRKAYERKGK